MFVPFEKWHGTKNDFVVLRLSDQDGEVVLGSIKRQAAAICDRHTGVGADGILVLHTKQRDDLTPYGLTIINSDGSLAKNCGNGLRCAALSVLKTHHERGNPNELPEAVEFVVEGVAILCRFLDETSLKTLVAVEMPSVLVGDQVAWGKKAKEAASVELKKVGLNSNDFTLEVCDLGNPHIVINTDKASRALMLAVGPALQDSCGIDGINVHVVKSKPMSDQEKSSAGKQLAQPVSELIDMYVWERGAGETMACGTGACAVAAAALQEGLSERSEWIGIDMPGGRVFIKQEDTDDPVTLAGPAQFVFSGSVEI